MTRFNRYEIIIRSTWYRKPYVSSILDACVCRPVDSADFYFGPRVTKRAYRSPRYSKRETGDSKLFAKWKLFPNGKLVFENRERSDISTSGLVFLPSINLFSTVLFIAVWPQSARYRIFSAFPFKPHRVGNMYSETSINGHLSIVDPSQ